MKAEAPYLGLQKTVLFYCGAFCKSYLNSTDIYKVFSFIKQGVKTYCI